MDNCIMVIDDNSNDLALIVKAFENNSIKTNILCIDNGHDALAYLMGDGVFADRKQNPYPSMLITDINMPGVDGFDILDYLQSNPAKEIIPTIVLSSSEDPDDIRVAYKLGAFSYLVKPFRFDDLCSQIGSLINYWRINKAPLREETGKQVQTDSKGKLGQRFSRLS
ncbi:response regulator [bacterium]|nr:response regulator [bacterium]